MGFGSTLGMFLIAFVFFMTFGAILFAMQSNFISEATAIGSKQSQMIGLQQANINITVFYNQTAYLTARVKNIGSVSIDISQIDFYVNGLIIPRNDAYRVIWFRNETKNPTLFDPGEMIGVNFTVLAQPNATLVVTAPLGAKDSATYPYLPIAAIINTTEELLALNGTNFTNAVFRARWALGDIAAANLSDGVNNLTINRSAGTRTSLVNMSLGNLSRTPLNISNVTVLMTFNSRTAGVNTFFMRLRSTSTGIQQCSKAIPSSLAKIVERMDCTANISVIGANGRWLILNNTAGVDAREYYVDFIRMNVTYTYEEPEDWI